MVECTDRVARELDDCVKREACRGRRWRSRKIDGLWKKVTQRLHVSLIPLHMSAPSSKASSFVCLCNKQNITCPHVDMNFIFSCSTLTRSLRSLVGYRLEQAKIKFISTRSHVISSISSSVTGGFIVGWNNSKYRDCAPFKWYYLTIILRNRAEDRLILSRQGRRPSRLKADDIPRDWAG